VNSKNVNQGKEKSCADYARSYVRGFITVYIAWFLGVDVEDGFWTTYFKPLERLWTINRAQRDISLMRSEGLVMKDRLRLTEDGWGCMEDVIVRFLKGEFGEYQSINIIKEYPETVLVAPGFAYEHGVDILDVISVRNIADQPSNMFETIYFINMNKGRRVLREIFKKISVDTYKFLVELLIGFLKIREVDLNDPLFMTMRASIGLLVRAAIADREFKTTIDGAPSRWLVPIIPYLANLGFKINLIKIIEVRDLGASSNELEEVLEEDVDIEPFVKNDIMSKRLEFEFIGDKQMLELVLQP
jgi:hypothetical protein